jgi:hypothetical protein
MSSLRRCQRSHDASSVDSVGFTKTANESKAADWAMVTVKYVKAIPEALLKGIKLLETASKPAANGK